jgi:putative phage-type endonuclease
MVHLKVVKGDNMEAFQIDRAKLQPIIDQALQNGRRIDLSKISTEMWLCIRAILGIGASEISSALGLNKFQTAYQLWQSKTSEEVEIWTNKKMRRGVIYEDGVGKAYAEDCGREIYAPKEIVIHPKHDCLFCTPDFLIKDNGDGKGEGVLQCKTTQHNVYKSWIEEETETQSIPIYYYCQIQMELECTNLNWGVLAFFLTDSSDFVYVPIKRDTEFIEKMVTFLVGWWTKFVLQNEAPPMTSFEFDHVEPIPGSVVEADEETLKLIETCQEKQKEEKLIKDEIESLKNKIKESIGEAELLTKDGNKIATYKTIKRAAYEVKESSYRQLKFVKEKK